MSTPSRLGKKRTRRRFVLDDEGSALELTSTSPYFISSVSAQIPIKNDPKANDAVTAKVKADKVREVTAGHDGT